MCPVVKYMRRGTWAFGLHYLSRSTSTKSGVTGDLTAGKPTRSRGVAHLGSVYRPCFYLFESFLTLEPEALLQYVIKQ